MVSRIYYPIYDVTHIKTGMEVGALHRETGIIQSQVSTSLHVLFAFRPQQLDLLVHE